MKHKLLNRTVALMLAFTCVLGTLPLSAFAADPPPAPDAITQKSADYMYSGGKPVRYESASDTVNAVGHPYVFNAQVNVPGHGSTRALCAYQKGTLGNGANGQKWNFKTEVTDPSLKALLTWVYSSTYGNFTPAGKAAGMETWKQMWSDLWFMTAQGLTWYYEHGVLKNCDTDREGFIVQVAEEFAAAYRMYHDEWGYSPWITDWDNLDIHAIINSADNGATGASAYDFATTAVNVVLDHPEYFYEYRLWEYEWDTSRGLTVM